MKLLTSKGLTQKIIIAIVIIILFSFIIPTYSSADLDLKADGTTYYQPEDGEEQEGVADNFGGVLLGPVIDFCAGIFDSILAGLQFFMFDGNLGNGVSITEGFLVSAKNYKQPSTDEISGDVTEITINSEDLDRGWINGIFSWLGADSVDAANYGIPVIKYTPEKIFSNKVPALQVNFINPEKYTDDGMQERNIAELVQPTIANWYVALRNLATVGLLSVLLYIGIRIIISSTGSDKAKYKKMLMDWLIALCILFFLHYVMSFMLEVTETVIDGMEINNQIKVHVEGAGGTDFYTDLTGLCRFQVQYADLGSRTIYLIMYIGLVICTCMFTWTYVKRVVTMAFLTLMAPMVALTYPLDKIRDGKAQAFNSWFKEYLFNLLIQPFHLLMYSAFLGSSLEIATVNPIFAIMFLAFLIPAEKLLRKFFGIGGETAGSLGAAAGLLGGAAVFKRLSGAVNKGAKGGSGGGSRGIRTKDNGQIESSSSPRGLGAFAGSPIPVTNGGTSGNQNRQRSQSPQNAQQQMVDAYDENNFGTQNFDATERDQMARDAYQSSLNEPNSYGADEYAQILRDSGYDENEIRNMMADDSRFAQDTNPEPEPTPSPMPSPEPQRFTRTATDGNGIKQKAGRIGRGVGHVLTTGVKRAVKATPRMALRAGVTAAGAAVGIGMGIASGDMDNVLSMGAAGAALGGTAGADAIMNTASRAGNALSRTYREGAYGEEEAALREQARNFSKDEANRNYIRQHYRNEDGSKLSRSQLNQAMARAAELNNNGVTDMKDIVKGLKLEDKLNVELDGRGIHDEAVRSRMAREQSTTIMKQVKGKDADYFRDEKKVTSLRNSYIRELEAGGLNREQAQAQTEWIINKMKEQRGAY